MGKLTKSQRKELEMVLSALDRLNLFIDNPAIAFCRVSEINQKVAQGPFEYRARDSHRTQHYIGRDNAEWDIDYVNQITPMDKGIGSDLVSRFTARKSLERFIENNS